MIVVDASVLATALAEDGADGVLARARLRGEQLACPSLADLETVSVWRGLVRSGQLTADRAVQAITDLQDLPIMRVEHSALLPRCWELRDNLTVYDAAYVALAEAYQATLLTADRRLAGATGPRCTIEVLDPRQA